MIDKLINPSIDPSQLQGNVFDSLNYINTLPPNLAMQIILIVLPLIIWIFWGFGRGNSKTIRLIKPNYFFFLVLIFIQVIILILYNFPIHLLIFE